MLILPCTSLVVTAMYGHCQVVPRLWRPCDGQLEVGVGTTAFPSRRPEKLVVHAPQVERAPPVHRLHLGQLHFPHDAVELEDARLIGAQGCVLRQPTFLPCAPNAQTGSPINPTLERMLPASLA